MKKEENLEEKSDLIENEEIESGEDFEEILSQILQVRLDTSKLESSNIDKKEFDKGIKSVSKIAGMYTCLKNVGMDNESALTIILNESNIKASCDQQKVANDMQKEIAKLQSIQIEKNQI